MNKYTIIQILHYSTTINFLFLESSSDLIPHLLDRSFDVIMFRATYHEVAVPRIAAEDCMAVSKLPAQSETIPIDDAPTKKPTSPAVRRRAMAWARFESSTVFPI